ncbi:hypothetical protein BDY21DRAFT_142985 [Lineolata rhizophorae]|uniref:Uncharacterized protein n=1 Tax=Lineolata rhizophorae TaxID=578093 RepID=A0A6A6NN72_9PEZI|nr:hypothetical protein BDY21DRAFT_142985 [Lineolata rhizophorae]
MQVRARTKQRDASHGQTHQTLEARRRERPVGEPIGGSGRRVVEPSLRARSCLDRLGALAAESAGNRKFSWRLQRRAWPTTEVTGTGRFSYFASRVCPRRHCACGIFRETCSSPRSGRFGPEHSTSRPQEMQRRRFRRGGARRIGWVLRADKLRITPLSSMRRERI